MPEAGPGGGASLGEEPPAEVMPERSPDEDVAMPALDADAPPDDAEPGFGDRIEAAGGRWWRRRGVVVLGLGLVVAAGAAGAAAGWRATGTEEYPPLVAAWALLMPLALSAVVFAVRRGPGARRRVRRVAGLVVAGLVVGGLALTTRAVDPCDLRGPGAVLVGCDLSGRDLSGADLAGGDLRGADLTEAKLVGAVLSRARLDEARLTGADLGKANLTKAHLEGAFLDRADLAGANLEEAVLTGASLVGADLTEASLWKARLPGASLEKARLVGVTLQDADLSRANLSGADLRRARGPGVNLAAATMTDATLDGASFMGAELGEANLAGASLDGTDLSRARAVAADFSKAVLQGTHLGKAALDRSTFSGARIQSANLREASLKGAVMAGVTMVDVAFDSAELEGVVDLDDSALAAALRVDPAALSRKLSLHDIRIDPPDRVLAAVGPACVGTPAAGTRAFTDSPAFRTNVVLNGEGKASDIGPLRQLRATARDGKWAPAGLRYAELVTCVDDEGSRQVGECGFYVNRETGVARSVVRVQLSRQIRVVSVATGEAVAERTFLGDMPRACQPTESFAPGTGPATVAGAAPSADEMQAWLSALVQA